MSHQVSESEEGYDVYILGIGAPYDAISGSYDFSEYQFGIDFGSIDVAHPEYSTINFDYQSSNPVTEFTIISNYAGFSPAFLDESSFEGYHLYLHTSQEVVHKLDSKYLPQSPLILYEVVSYNPEVHTFYLDKGHTQLFGSTNYSPASESEAIQYYTKTADILNSASGVYINRIDSGGAPIQNDLFGPLTVHTHYSGYGEQGPNNIKIHFYIVQDGGSAKLILLDHNSYD